MVLYHVYRDGVTSHPDGIEREWVAPGSPVRVWADVRKPTPEDAEVLREVFGIHPLAVDHALEAEQHPRLEVFERVLYVVLHGINFERERDTFETHDTDFFLTKEYLVTVHDGQRRSIAHVEALCHKTDLILAEGTSALMHRIIDTMVDHYRPEIDEVELELDRIEDEVIQQPSGTLTRNILTIKRDLAQMRRILLPQRDVVGRLARREFDVIDQEMAYRFRDVSDQLVRFADEAMIFQERVTGILDAHLASISNRLARSSQHLSAVATVFGTLTVITGLYGMNVRLPVIGESEGAQFWWIVGLMAASTAGLYVFLRAKDWL